MRIQQRVSGLLVGGALVTFLFTLVTFVSSVAPLQAQDCFTVGTVIGAGCLMEGFTPEECPSCAYPLCGMYAFPPGYPPDYNCAVTCGAGAVNAGCTG